MKSKLITAIVLIISITNSFAGSSDSVITHIGTPPPPTTPVFVETYTDYKKDFCPTGLMSNGSVEYVSLKRTVNNYYQNNQLIKAEIGNYESTGNVCTGSQSQTIECPTGFNGAVIQSRTVSFSNGSYSYGNWTNTSNTCVINPPPAPGIWTFTARVSGSTTSGGSCWDYQLPLTPLERTSCSPKGKTCWRKDDMTTSNNIWTCR